MSFNPGIDSPYHRSWVDEGWWRNWSIFVLVAHSLVVASPVQSAIPVAPVHPSRILVMPRDPSRLPALEQFHHTHQRHVLRSFAKLGHLQVVELRSGEAIGEAITSYRASGLARFAEADFAVSAASTLPGDPRFQDGTQWWLNNYGQDGGLAGADLDGPEGWDVGHEAADVVVAVVDSGVRLSHEDLAANLWTNPLDQSHGYNALTGRHDPEDDNGHGTHLAGILGALGDNGKGGVGVAWRVQIMACKFLNSAGNGFNSDAIACIEFARSNHANVINLSWGGPDFSEAISNALSSVGADGILVAAAAGNNAGDIDLVPYYPASLRLKTVIAVGASTRTDAVWSLSNYGRESVDLFAPGTEMYSTSSGGDTLYAARQGTSMAAACVAGALALLRHQAPGATVAEQVARLNAAVDPSPAFANKCATGGRLNLRKLLDRPAIAVASSVQPFQARITGAPGHRYTLTTSTNLANWTTFETNTTAADGIWTFTDPDSTNRPRRFYRAGPAP